MVVFVAAVVVSVDAAAAVGGAGDDNDAVSIDSCLGVKASNAHKY